MSKITVNDIWAEDIFKYLWHTVTKDGGDGSGALVCENYKEVASWFSKWVLQTQGKDYDKSLAEETNRMLIRSRDLEYFVFSGEPQQDKCHADYLFIVDEDCVFGMDSSISARVIKAAKTT